MLVDDNVEILRLLKENLNLKFLSTEVHAAYNGSKALELRNNLTRKGINIDFMLADDVMPIMNGAELCKFVK